MVLRLVNNLNRHLIPVSMETNFKYLRNLVTAKIDRSPFNATFLAEQIYTSMELKTADACVSYLRCVEKGDIYGQPNFPRNPKAGLDRLAILLFALGFSENHSLIEGIKKRVSPLIDEGLIDEGFEYPPDNGLSYVQIVEAYEAMKNDQEVHEVGLEAIV